METKRQLGPALPAVGCGTIAAAIVFVVVLIAALSAFKRVDPGYAGVIIDYGAGTTTGHPVIRDVPTGEYVLLNPSTQRIVEYPIGQNILVMVRSANEGQVQGDDSVECQDQNGIPLHVDSRTYWRVDPAAVGQLYLLYPDKPLTGRFNADIESQVIRSEVRNAIVLGCSRFTYDKIYGPQKADFYTSTEQVLNADLKKDNIILDRFVGGEIYLNKDQQDAVNAKATAQQSAEAAAFLAQKAKNEADAAIAQAEGQKTVKITQAQADAESIRIINQQLAQSPHYVEYLYATKWDGKYPATLVTSGGSSPAFVGTLPLGAAGPTPVPSEPPPASPSPAPAANASPTPASH